ncbi:MAG: hypothetical protein JWQ14_3121 [Adhaeribacter sp.]|nr:hypothetical protein [Adhaeribacter sp.]
MVAAGFKTLMLCGQGFHCAGNIGANAVLFPVQW